MNQKPSRNNDRRNFIVSAASLCSLAYAERLLGQVPSSDRAKGPLERIIFVYHPDGVFFEQWHPNARSGPIVEWKESLLPLQPYRDQLTLFRFLTLLDGQGDGHDEAAKALLTGNRSPSQGSLDVHLAQSLGQNLLHVGVQSSKNQGQSISYFPGGFEKTADDSPLSAFQRFFSVSNQNGGSATDPKILASLEKELRSFVEKVDVPQEKLKLQQHLQQIVILRENASRCGAYDFGIYGYAESKKLEDRSSPLVLSLQILNIVEAMACGLSRVASLQISRHTSQLKMDFDWLGRWNNQLPMESHQASHNSGEIHAQQKKWVNTQLTRLLAELASRPDPAAGRSGSMLDNTLVVVLTEVGQGASHGRKDMPYYMVGGRAVPGLDPGRIIDCGGAPHSQLLVSLSQLMGQAPQGAYAGAGGLRPLLT